MSILLRCLIEFVHDLVNEFKSKLKINESKYGYQIDYEEKFPKFSFSQIGEWIETMWFDGVHDARERREKFWHAWCFDWRGRMYTCSNLLSPQGDDLSRGLLLFGEEENLDETGWKWMRRAIGRFMKAVNLKKLSLMNVEFSNGVKSN